MGQRKEIFLKDQYYHIYNRGVNQQHIFQSEDNYYFLLNRMKKYSGKFNISIIAYCLMPNHYHLLLRQNDNFSAANFIQLVFNSYSKAFNNMYHRSGTLFQGKFKSILVDNEAYLVHLCRYIHRNPIDCENPLVDKLRDWQFSNFPDWIGVRNGTLIDREFVKIRFSSPERYVDFVLNYEPLPKLVAKLQLYVFD